MDVFNTNFTAVNMVNQRAAVIQFAGSKLQKTEFNFGAFSDHDEMMAAFARKVRFFTGG
jgi:hypothetical protein